MRFFLQRSDEGYTFMEAVITLAVVLLTAGSVFSVLFGTSRFLGKLCESVGENVEIIVVERAFREALAGIRPPFWNAGLDVQMRGRSFRVPFLNGDSDSFLTCSCGSGYLVIAKGDGENRYALKSEASFEAIDEDGYIQGIKLRLLYGDGEIEILGYFGTMEIVGW